MTTPVRSASVSAGGPAVDARSAGRHRDPLEVLGLLVERDRQLLAVLAEHQVLTTAQICELAFPSLHVAQRRLLRLTRLGVLDRFRRQLPAGSESWRYTLGPVGATLIAAERGVEAPRPAELRRRALRLAASPRLGHLLGVNGWFCALAADGRTRPGAGLMAWWSERRCAEHYGQLVRPDAYGAWTEGSHSVAFFLEYDAGTEPLRRVVAKLAGYGDLGAAGGPRHCVLLWLQSATREAHLHEVLADRQPPCPVATATAELARARGCSPAGPIWLVPGSHERRRLIGLAPVGQ